MCVSTPRVGGLVAGNWLTGEHIQTNTTINKIRYTYQVQYSTLIIH